MKVVFDRKIIKEMRELSVGDYFEAVDNEKIGQVVNITDHKNYPYSVLENLNTTPTTNSYSQHVRVYKLNAELHLSYEG